MGTVYQASHKVLGRKVAIKILRSDLALRPDMTERFLIEARAGSRIHHKNICEIFDVGVLEDGRRYLMMELLEGEDLKQRLDKRRPLPPGEVVSMAAEVASALEAAHAAGVIHRDLKPENVFLARDRQKGVQCVKLLDFGIAKLLHQEGRRYKTRIGALLGTPTYMSPEQARGDPNLGPKTDIYSLGVILYECLTGVPPFPQSSYVQLLRAHQEMLPPPLRRVRPGLPEEMERLVLACLTKNPAERPDSATLRHRLLGLLPRLAFSTEVAPEPVETNGQGLEHDTEATVFPRRRFRSRLLFLAGALGLLGAGFLVLYPDVPRRSPARLPRVAERPPAQTVLTHIETFPRDAEVFSGGVFLGKTPLLVPLGPAPREIVLRRGGYHDLPLLLTPGQDISVRLRPLTSSGMVREAGAYPR